MYNYERVTKTYKIRNRKGANKMEIWKDIKGYERVISD